MTVTDYLAAYRRPPLIPSSLEIVSFPTLRYRDSIVIVQLCVEFQFSAALSTVTGHTPSWSSLASELDSGITLPLAHLLSIQKPLYLVLWEGEIRAVD